MKTTHQGDLEQTQAAERLQTTIKELCKVIEYKEQETRRLWITLGLVSFLLVASRLLRVEQKSSIQYQSNKALSK